MNKIPNRQVINDVLLERAESDKKIMVLASDARGSAKLTEFADTYPDQFVETGIAEQNLVGVSAGLASGGLKPFVASPACFLSMRSVEQVKVDVAYSNTNVKLIGISGGVSYGALGMSHHSVQDIAVMRAIPNLEVYLPADRHETKKLFEILVDREKPAYIRIGRNPVPDVYESDDYDFEIGKAVTLVEGDDLTITACGETVHVAVEAAKAIKEELGLSARVLNFHTLKPFDNETVVKAAKETGYIISMEEHSIFGGLGSTVASVTAGSAPVKVDILGIPDEPAIAGVTGEVFDHYGLSVKHVVEMVRSHEAMRAQLQSSQDTKGKNFNQGGKDNE